MHHLFYDQRLYKFPGAPAAYHHIRKEILFSRIVIEINKVKSDLYINILRMRFHVLVNMSVRRIVQVGQVASLSVCKHNQ